jgi:hypothetical protein
MPTNTYVALRQTTLGTATSSVTFDLTGITGYTDLVLVSNLRYSSGTPSGNAYIRFNGDSGTNYSRTFLQGDGTSATSGRASNENGMYILGNTATASVFTTNITQIQNYANSTTNKTVLNRWSNAGDFALAFVSLWRSTSAITTIDIIASGTTNFAVGSTFSLYGIASTTAQGAKAQGGIITSDDLYWYHTFRATDTFTPLQSLTCDYLVVAGGGGGTAQPAAGGGGAGGYRTSVGTTGGGGTTGTALSVTATPYTITVGAGGTGGVQLNTTSQSNGTDSTFSTITSTGGGKAGGSTFNQTGFSGGAGGGGGSSQTNGVLIAGGTGTANQGFDGGSGRRTNGYANGGGGGGAGGAGQDAPTTAPNGIGGAGGSGLISSFDSIARGGGGGGGGEDIAGTASAGGGAGGVGTVNNGTANTGGGGGGSQVGSPTPAGSGGSGIVIIRYLKA